MASPGSDTPRTSPAAPIRKPLAILHISKKEEEDRRLKEAADHAAVEAKAQAAASKVQPGTPRGSQPGVPQNNAAAERANGDVLEGTRSA